jgi:indolepyruvate ferredoxin oxidoreductase, beta subunit
MASAKNVVNIALVGVGGQGTLLASEVISRTAMLAGRDVKKSEVHGMAQRGGSVVSQVRYGDHVYSPLIPEGETDVLISFELVESLRYADTVAPDGIALINDQIITPVTVSSGQQAWVDDLEERLERAFPRRQVIDALVLARDLGNLRVVNMVMAGALSRVLDLEERAWLQAIEELVPARHREVNLRAFAAGRALTPTHSPS